MNILSSAHGTLPRNDCILGCKANLNKFKSIEIISDIFSDHNGMKLEINHKKRNEKKVTTWKLNNMLLKNQCVNEEIKKYLKEKNKNKQTNNNISRQMTMKTQFKIYGMPQKQFLERSS